mgnify:CR=1 FL=1
MSHFFFNWLILETRTEIQKWDHSFLVQMKTLKFVSEIYWPLVQMQLAKNDVILLICNYNAKLSVYALSRPKLNCMTFDLAYLKSLKPDMSYNFALWFLNCTIWQRFYFLYCFILKWENILAKRTKLLKRFPCRNQNKIKLKIKIKIN